MKTSIETAVGAASLLASSAALAQNTHMMNNSMWDGGWMMGYGGMWTPILVLLVVVALVVWIVKRGGK